MRPISWVVALLLCSPATFAVTPADGSSTTGLWTVDGVLLGTSVKLTCRLTETGLSLSGACAGAPDNFAPHTATGEVDGHDVAIVIGTDVHGSPITLTARGILSDDRQTVTGTLKVEPMGVGGIFTAKRVTNSAAASLPTPDPNAPTNTAVVLRFERAIQMPTQANSLARLLSLWRTGFGVRRVKVVGTIFVLCLFMGLIDLARRQRTDALLWAITGSLISLGYLCIWTLALTPWDGIVSPILGATAGLTGLSLAWRLRGQPKSVSKKVRLPHEEYPDYPF